MAQSFEALVRLEIPGIGIVEVGETIDGAALSAVQTDKQIKSLLRHKAIKEA